jgi:hypothetical protein
VNSEDRAAYRAFVRENHPDRGGDPEVFVAGLAQFREAGLDHPGLDHLGPDPVDDPRFDAPVEVVTPLPFPVRVGVALIRTWHRRRNQRVL